MPPIARSQQIKGFVILTLAFRQDADRWTGECVELGTATYADTLDEVHGELVELVELHLSTLEQTGECEYFFKKHGIRCYAEAAPSKVRQTLNVGDESFLQALSFPVACAG